MTTTYTVSEATLHHILRYAWTTPAGSFYSPAIGEWADKGERNGCVLPKDQPAPHVALTPAQLATTPGGYAVTP